MNIKKDQQLIAVQVCYQQTPQNRQRAFRGLEKLKLVADKKWLITYNQSKVIQNGIEALPFWDVPLA